MSEVNEETVEGVKTEDTSAPAPAPSHAEMFFRYVSALAGAAGVQAFTLAIAAPREDGKSQILAYSAGSPNAPREWQVETAAMLGDAAAKSAVNIIAPVKVEEEKPVEVV
jgi:hypothetical protein